MSQRVSLVLGAGGARGYAHIGAIEALEAQGYEIGAISGASMGALIGALYARGTLQEYRDWVLSLNAIDVLKLVDVSFSEAGMIKGDRVFEKMSYLFKDSCIEELPIPFSVVATDLEQQQEVWLSEGCLKTAVRASMAIPMLLKPVRLEDGRLLIDGGVLNPLPLPTTQQKHIDRVIAIDVNASHGDLNAPDQPAALTAKAPVQPSGWQAGLQHLLHSIGLSQDAPPSPTTAERDMFDIMNRMLETMQRAMIRYKIADHPPDLLVQVPTQNYRFYDFHKAQNLIELGRQEMLRALEQSDARDTATPQEHRAPSSSSNAALRDNPPA